MTDTSEKEPGIEKAKGKFLIKTLLLLLFLVMFTMTAIALVGWWENSMGEGLAMLVVSILLGVIAFYEDRRWWRRIQEETQRKSQPDFFQGGGI